MNRELLISYAYVFVSFLFSDPKVKKAGIKSVYLFGSVARGDFDKESDIDIFIDSEIQETEGLIDRVTSKFLNSDENKKFIFMGITNEIKPMYGKLSEWELYESVKNDGILLYSSSVSEGMKPFFLVTLDPIKNVSKRNKIMRKLVGRKEKYYKGGGLIKELGGESIDTRVFLVPSESVKKILALFSREKVDYTLKKIWL